MYNINPINILVQDSLLTHHKQVSCFSFRQTLQTPTVFWHIPLAVDEVCFAGPDYRIGTRVLALQNFKGLPNDEFLPPMCSKHTLRNKKIFFNASIYKLMC